MRIAIVNKFLYPLGGSQAVVMTEANLLREAGWDVNFFGVNHPNTMEGLDERKYFPDHMDLSNAARQYSILTRLHYSLRILYNIQAKKKFEQFLTFYKPDIIHFHNIYNHLGPSLLHAAKKRKIPAVMSLHDYNLVCPNYTLKRGQKVLCNDHRCFNGKYWHCIINKCIKDSFSASALGAIRLALHRQLHWFERNLKLLIAPSDFIKDTLIQDGIPEKQIYRLYNTMPFQLTRYIKTLPDNGRIDKLKVIQKRRKPFIYVGRLSYEKGLITLVKAFMEMPDIKLVIVGTGPQENEIKRLIKINHAQNIDLLGYKKGEELWKLMMDSYVFCLASECFEVMPISLIESFSLGIPAIGAKVGGIPEVIQHEHTGWLFTPGNIESLKNAIKESLLVDDDDYLKMSHRAQEWVQSNHSPEAHISGLLKVYERALI